jgi:hypothetical protein
MQQFGEAAFPDHRDLWPGDEGGGLDVHGRNEWDDVPSVGSAAPRRLVVAIRRLPLHWSDVSPAPKDVLSSNQCGANPEPDQARTARRSVGAVGCSADVAGAVSQVAVSV